MTDAPLLERWRAAWPDALAAWSIYTMLREPRFIERDGDAEKDGMRGQIAAIRLRDHAVMVNVEVVRARGLEDDALAILAHEIGHHVYVPGNAADHARLIAAIARMLSGLPKDAVHMVANLYADLLINDRLQRRAEIDVARVYAKLEGGGRGGAPSQVWSVYTRAYEHLWRLAPGSIAPHGVGGDMDADAMLVARIVRSFAGEWLRGARRFAAVLYPYLVADQEAAEGNALAARGLHDTRGAASGAIPDGLTQIDPSEIEDDDGFDDAIGDPLEAAPRAPAARGGGTGQHRTPFEYGQLLESLGLDLDAGTVRARYYKERALPHLVPFPERRAPRATEPLAEGYAAWGADDPLEALDVLGSTLGSPHLIPGVTTVQRVFGETPGTDPARLPVDLDVYVDCSGSMPNPAIQVSHLALCGTILALSALRVGARVQATLWSSAGRFETTGGFIRDEKRLLATITGYVCGGTAFPIHVLRDTYRQRKPSEPPAHVVVISDDGVDTMLRKDEHGNDGAVVAEAALASARGGGTLVLNLRDPGAWPCRETFERLGFRLHAVQSWEDVVAFARAFAAATYGVTAGHPR